MTMYNWRTGHARLGTCQSLRGRFSRLTFRPRELSTNNNNYLSIYLSVLSIYRPNFHCTKSPFQVYLVYYTG